MAALEAIFYRKVVEGIIIDIFYIKLQLLPAIRQDSGAFIFQQNCHIAQDVLVF